MGFWSWLGLTDDGPNHEGVTPNSNDPATVPPASVGETEWRPGDPDGVVMDDYDPPSPLESRSLPYLSPSPWSGWPADWSTPSFAGGGHLGKLIDVAWDCIDLNASVLSTMPAYLTRNGRIMDPPSWLSNPDPTIYQSWQEFAKQLFWDFQMGEAFVLAMTYRADGYPATFRVVPPWMMHVGVEEGLRTYRIGSERGRDVTSDILHIRYQSSTDPGQPRGIGPLEGAGARMVTAGVLQKYVQNLSQTGGVPMYWISSDQTLTQAEAEEMQRDFVEARRRNLGEPAVFGHGAKLEQARSMSARDMALLEIAQWSESRIAVKLGVPPFLMGLPSGGDSMTYSNVSQLFDFHDRASLRTKAGAVMPALSQWLLPRGQSVELNRDEYSRPALLDRANAYDKLIERGVLTPQEVRMMERFDGPTSASALTGGDSGGE